MITISINRLIRSEYLSLALRIYVGYLFVYASLGKIPHPAQFAEVIADYRLIPFMFVNATAILLPWIEFVAGFFLIIGYRSRGSAIVIGMLLFTSTVMILINMYQAAPITCGCYDAVGEPIGWKKVMENTFTLFFSAQIFCFDKPELFRKLGNLLLGSS